MTAIRHALLVMRRAKQSAGRNIRGMRGLDGSCGFCCASAGKSALASEIHEEAGTSDSGNHRRDP